ncbi:MAG: DEAD/DEAH box helicase [Deltaproteobacteria bacterium]|jgi:ATP-dependent RNA helicase RhlE|nr:DEAD/DEAH box helicase [Deltaproteobacteria bacterium]
MTFNHFDFHAKITAGIRACNYEIPTPIQEKAIPEILEGRDILGLAQTGTGKTAAFVLPILQRMLKGQRRKIRTLIVAPTRELAEQIHGEITRLARQTGLRSLAVYGGVGKPAQAKKLRAGVDIVVACPGRLLDHLRDRTFNLSGVEHLILDEGDHMFDMGFLPDIRRILKFLPAKRQNLLFSATMPGEILHLAEDVLDNPVRIQIGHSRPTTTVSQMLYAVDQNGKVSLLKEIMAGKDMASTLIFTRTKHRAQSLASQLQKAGYAATSLQGNLSQQKRQKALNGFRRGEFKVLVATDIAARGIDVSNISHVINFDMPATVDAYTHRIGRTGRAACTGKAFTFASREDRKIVSQIERTLGEKLVWVNQKNTSEGVPDNTSFAERPSKKSWHKAKYNCRQAGQRNGHQAGRPAKAAKTGKQEQAPVKYCKAGNRQMRKRRAAIMIDGSGNFFLNP